MKEIEAQLGLENIESTLCQELSKMQSQFKNQLLKFADLKKEVLDEDIPIIIKNSL